MTRIVYMSDLHFEINGIGKLQDPDNVAEGDILVLAGDIAPARFLGDNKNDAEARAHKKALNRLKEDLFPRFDKVFMVLGNHEHYRHVFHDTRTDVIHFFNDTPNFFLLDDQSIYSHDILFVGGTLWTNCEKHDPMIMERIRYGMNDYAQIWTRPPTPTEVLLKKLPGITPHDTVAAHDDTLAFFQHVIDGSHDIPVVVISHHAPAFQSAKGRLENDPLAPAYYSRLEEFILDRPTIKAWIHGHTHHNVDYKIGETRVVANMAGYNFDSTYKNFKPDKWIDV